MNIRFFNIVLSLKFLDCLSTFVFLRLGIYEGNNVVSYLLSINEFLAYFIMIILTSISYGLTCMLFNVTISNIKIKKQSEFLLFFCYSSLLSIIILYNSICIIKVLI